MSADGPVAPGPTGSELITQSQATDLLRYAQLTYRAVTEQRRRIALIALVIACVFGVIALWAGSNWLGATSAIDEVEDASIVDVMGVQIPDPRPALERGELRLKAFGWGIVGGTSLLFALLAFGIYLLVRPTPLPRDLAAAAGARGASQPPMYDISTRSRGAVEADRSSE